MADAASPDSGPRVERREGESIKSQFVDLQSRIVELNNKPDLSVMEREELDGMVEQRDILGTEADRLGFFNQPKLRLDDTMSGLVRVQGGWNEYLDNLGEQSAKVEDRSRLALGRRFDGSKYGGIISWYYAQGVERIRYEFGKAVDPDTGSPDLDEVFRPASWEYEVDPDKFVAGQEYRSATGEPGGFGSGDQRYDPKKPGMGFTSAEGATFYNIRPEILSHGEPSDVRKEVMRWFSDTLIPSHFMEPKPLSDGATLALVDSTLDQRVEFRESDPAKKELLRAIRNEELTISHVWQALSGYQGLRPDLTSLCESLNNTEVARGITTSQWKALGRFPGFDAAMRIFEANASQLRTRDTDSKRFARGSENLEGYVLEAGGTVNIFANERIDANFTKVMELAAKAAGIGELGGNEDSAKLAATLAYWTWQLWGEAAYADAKFKGHPVTDDRIKIFPESMMAKKKRDFGFGTASGTKLGLEIMEREAKGRPLGLAVSFMRGTISGPSGANGELDRNRSETLYATWKKGISLGNEALWENVSEDAFRTAILRWFFVGGKDRVYDMLTAGEMDIKKMQTRDFWQRWYKGTGVSHVDLTVVAATESNSSLAGLREKFKTENGRDMDCGQEPMKADERVLIDKRKAVLNMALWEGLMEANKRGPQANVWKKEDIRMANQMRIQVMKEEKQMGVLEFMLGGMSGDSLSFALDRQIDDASTVKLARRIVDNAKNKPESVPGKVASIFRRVKEAGDEYQRKAAEDIERKRNSGGGT